MKPANVMISSDGLAKVVDFGLAKRGAAPSKVGQAAMPEPRATFQTATGFVIGTPAYMAPEQLDPTETIDARADQFAWALTAYALMLGKNLRKDDPLLFGPIPLLSDRVPGISRRAAEIVLRALSNDREMRFPSMDALVAELEPALALRTSGLPLRVSLAPAVDSGVPSGRHSQPPTPRMASAPPSVRRFCPECGLSFAMSSPKCKGPHAEAFPRPPGIEDDFTR
jgi:serine/threonine-protein kinase